MTERELQVLDERIESLRKQAANAARKSDECYKHGQFRAGDSWWNAYERFTAEADALEVKRAR